MKKLTLGLLVIGFTLQSFAQVISDGMLDEVVVYATNYKYLTEAGTRDAAEPVKMLERKVADFDLKESELYQDEWDYYKVSFFIPEGKIVAAYDKDGNILRTIEKFKNIKVPKSVAESVLNRFPGWVIFEDVYKVNYHKDKGVKKIYKLTLENGDKRMKVKTDENGNFLK